MADEQQEWLDADAAEKLLRGESVEPVDDHARTEARQLEAAVLALRTPGPADGELPGEAAVLAAFREASLAGKRAGAVRPAGLAGQQDALRTVRMGKAPKATLRRPRWTRPVRYGLAVSLAGCALGGVAVAGGTGMLPAPFGGQGSPVPATSVSAAASPEELGVEVPDGSEPSPLPPAVPGEPSPPAAADEPDAGTAGSDGRTGQDGGATEREDEAPDSVTGGTDATGDAENGSDGREVPGRPPAEVYKKSVKACRDYRADALSRPDERRLLELADGEANLDRFCDQLLGTDDRDGGGAEDGKSGDSDKDTGGSGGAESGADNDGDGESSLPAVSLRTPSALPSATR
ncbi:hypothetical protein ACFYQ5_14300 [Streptomyces sp. NPDC005794]|uniref:hypothetical protein n=1 Tax=Streptomyces sp. NPDC005794 TaxID=3364733 RepID=UPI0036897832